MKKIDWLKKLTSRKFWIAVCGLVSGIIIACNGGEATAQTVTGLLMSAASIVSYILGEAWADACSDAHVEIKEEEELDEDVEVLNKEQK